MVLFSSLEHIFTTIITKFKILIFCISTGPHGVCGIFRPPVQGGSNELISKFLSSMILYNYPSYFKSGEINSCRLSPLPINTQIEVKFSKLVITDISYFHSNHPSKFCRFFLGGGHTQYYPIFFLTLLCRRIKTDPLKY